MNVYHSIVKNILLIAAFSVFVVLPGRVFSQESNAGIEDSLANSFTIEELVKLKKVLEQEKARLIKEQEKDLERGIDLSKDFLTQTRADNENQDMILIRVAEYYIEEADAEHDKRVEEYNKMYDGYEKELDAYNKGQLKIEPKAPVFPPQNYEKPIAIYDLILNNFPESELVDDALYSKAYLLDQMGEGEAARDVYLELIDKYPESEYAPEAYIQMAEYYFQPRIGQNRDETIRNLNKAAQLYKNVLKYKESPRYDEALYKLGWSYYRLAAANPQYYSDAILYFNMVIQDVQKFKSIDPEGKYVKANIEPEALQYLAASFVDTSYTKDGVEKAKRFINALDSPPYGVDVMADMGDLYARIVDYDNSILAYQTLLEMYPDYPHAPLIDKKIADVYLEANQPEKAYSERQNLFTSYNPKTEWYANLEQSDIKDRILILDEANRITEEALRSNLLYQLQMAQTKDPVEKGIDTTAAYNEFARLSQSYLETYPTHENAYEINWSLAFILDTKLHRYREAFEEYIRVSNDYLESSHRQDAATDAIVVAQTLVNEKTTSVDTAQIGGIDMSQLTAQELTDEQKLLAEAFDNYIKLFPNDEKTASYLSSAGALYYQHRQYDLARKYYKTMVTKFPEAQQRSVGLISLMNSYFFLGKFPDAEFVAKKILQVKGIPEDQKEVARKRIGESIYKNAEKLEQQENYLQAASEYYRVFKDASYYSEITDLALFNSARNYEKANEWQQAINVYDTLVTNYEKSQYRLVSLGRIADDYKQMENFAGVGSAYERIYRLYPESKDSEAALYNASLFYAKANSWSDAIRVNDLYIEKFPEKPDAKDLMFENARYYLKLDDLANANRIYDEFAQRYPDDPRAIEAYYRRGEFYYRNNQFALAKQEFQKAITRSEEYARTGRDPNLLFASEAYFKLGEIEYQDFKDVKLGYPETNLRAQLEMKRDKLVSTVDAFTKVISMGSLKGFEAMYKIAEVQEDMANAIADQELPPNLTEEQQLVERDRVFRAAVPAYDRAVDEYKNVIKNIPVLAQKLEISIADTNAEEPGQIAEEDSSTIVKKETMQDSTREIALRWYGKAQDKVSLVLYTVAERSAKFIHAYLRQENPATGLVYLSWKKLLLEKAIAPAVNVTINAHLKNITMSEQLGLHNKYVEESKRKILLTSAILADEYGKLFKKAVDIYKSQLPTLVGLIEGGDQAATPDGLNSLDYNDQMLSTIDYMNEFLSVALTQYENTLKFAKDNNINNDAVLTTQDRLFNLSYESGSELLGMANNAIAKRDSLNKLSETTGDPKYQLGIVFFYDQQSILKDYAQRDLEHGYQISKDYNIKSVWTNLILAKLVELNPAEYLGDLPKEKFIVTTDSTWLATKEYKLDWTKPDFNDTDWKHASVVKLPLSMSFAGFDSLPQQPLSIWIYQSQPVVQTPLLPTDTSLTPDSTAGLPSGPRSLELEDKEPLDETTLAASTPVAQDSTIASVPSEPDTVTAYFRKHFNLPDRAISGWALITGDDEYHLYLNGEYIKGDETGVFENVDQVSFIELSDFLKKGENVLGVDVTDFDNVPRYGLRFYMQLEMLPGEITSAAERIRRQAAENVDMKRLKNIVILNKNRVLSQ